MTKHDPEELHELVKDLDQLERAHRELLNDEPRILNPLRETQRAAKTKYDDVRTQRA